MELLVVPTGALLSPLAFKHRPFLDSTSFRKPSLTTPQNILYYLSPLTALFYNYLFLYLSLPFPTNYEQIFGGKNYVLLNFVYQPLTQKHKTDAQYWAC